MKAATRRLLEEQLVVVAVLGSGKKSDAMWHVSQSLCHRRRVAGPSILCKINSNSNHCLLIELPSVSTRVRNPELQP